MRVSQLQRMLVAMLFALASPCQAVFAADEVSVEVISHPDLDAAYMAPKYLRAVFTMNLRTWPNGQRVHLFVLGDNDPVHQAFCRQYLGTYPYVLRTIWDRRVFTGTGVPPEVVRDEQEMREEVLSTPGAIGYVSRAEVGTAVSHLFEFSARTIR